MFSFLTHPHHLASYKIFLINSKPILYITSLYLSLSLSFFLISCGSFEGISHYVPNSSGHYKRKGSDPLQRRRLQPSQKYSPKGAFHLIWPVEYIKLTQYFSPPSNPSHQGVDLGGKKGTSIRAAHEGLVVYAGKGYRGYGNMILVEFSEMWATLYAHLDSILVREGDIVGTGDVIGRMGNTGRASGVHLHFELMKDKQPVNPLKYLNHPQKFTGGL